MVRRVGARGCPAGPGVTLAAMSAPTLAHAVADSIGALPLSLVLAALAGLFLAAGAVGTRRAASPAPPRTPTPAEEPAAAASAPTPAGGLGQSLGAVGLGVLLLLAAFGPADASENLADVFVLLILWGLVAVTSMVLGPVWYRVDPLAGVNRALGRLTGDAEATLTRPLPRWTDAAAVLGLLLWAWAQLLLDLSVLAALVLLLAYVLVHVVAAGVYGRSWLQRVESLNVMSGLLGLLRPGQGGPLERLTSMADSARLRWVASTLVAWSAADLLLETEWWHDLAVTPGTEGVLGPLVLLGATVLLGLAASAASRRAALGPALVPLAGGWVVSHYLSVLLIEGQGVLVWLSDPFDTGADLLGRSGDLIDLEPLPVGVLVALQIVPFVVGHLAAVVVAQRRAARRAAARPVRTAGSLPLDAGAGAATPSSTVTVGAVSAATLELRALVVISLLGGTYLQLGGL